MIRKIIHHYVVKTHHWRDSGHRELSELYVSNAIRTLAVSMVGVFLPIYLYNLDYSIQAIVGFYLVFALVRVPVNFAVGYVVGRIGPKHTIIISTFLNIIYMSMLLSLPSVGWPIYLLAGIYSLTNGLFFISYHTDFSKVKHVKHAGKEYSYMMVVQKIGSAIGPFIGGLIAGFADISISIGIAASLLLLSLVPLFMSKEPVRTHQHITYKGLLKKFWIRRRNILALSAVNSSGFVMGSLWHFWLALTIFSAAAYESIGLIATGSTIISMFTAKLFGRLTDSGQARNVLRLSAITNFALGIWRLFINSPVPAIAHDTIRQQALTARGISFVKGYYDEADEFPDQRIAFIVLSENIAMLFRALCWTAILVAVSLGNPVDMLRYCSAAAAAVGLLAMLEKYRALDD